VVFRRDFAAGKGALRRLFWVVLLAGSAGAQAFELTGSVKDFTDSPAADADVWLWRDHEVWKTATDSEGRFTFAEAGEGLSQVVVRKEGFALGGAEVYLGGPRNVEITLAEPVTVTLRVVDASFNPVPGTRLRAMYIAREFGVAAMDLAEHGFPSLRADDAGLLVITGMPRDSHFAFVLYHPKYAETRVPHLPVQEGQQAVTLYPGVPIRGRVLSPQGEPVERARVVVYQTTTTGYKEAAERLTDRDGFYHAVVTPADYYVIAHHPDYAAPHSREVKVQEADREKVVDLTLVEARPLEGRIVGPNNEPGIGIAVRYLVDDAVYGETRSYDDGLFRMSVPVGRGALRIIAPPGFATEYFGDITVRVDPGARADAGTIRLKQLPAVQGVIVDADGKPQDHVLIASRNLTPPMWALTDEQGRFFMQMSYVPEGGKAEFLAEHGLRFLRQEFTADLQAPEPLRVTLAPFEPTLEEPPAPEGGNDLTDLLGIRAPEPEVDHWFNSTPFTLDQLRGKVIVLTLWGGFDEIGPSRDRMFELCALHALYKDAGDVVIFGIHDNGSEPAEIEEYIRGYGIEFPVARDVETFSTFRRYATKTIPQTVVIDKRGKVRSFLVEGRLLELIKVLRRESADEAESEEVKSGEWSSGEEWRVRSSFLPPPPVHFGH
jgi:hypothetical protein